MANWNREDAKISLLHYRKPLPGGGERLVKAPYNLIQYPDDQTTYVEPVPTFLNNPQTWADQTSDATQGERVVIDGDPYAGVTEIR